MAGFEEVPTVAIGVDMAECSVVLVFVAVAIGIAVGAIAAVAAE